MFLQSLRKIRTSTTTRRRPARKCEVGIESLDTRAVPAIIVPSPGSPLLESGTGQFGQTIMNVAFDEYGHGSASLTTTNPFNGAVTTRATLLPTNLDASGKPQPIPGINLGLPTPTPQMQPILTFGQQGGGSPFHATRTGSTTTLSATDVPVTITQISASGVTTPVSAFLNLSATSTGPATSVGGDLTQPFSGSFSVSSNPGNTGAGNINYLSGPFSDALHGSGTSLTLSVSNQSPPGTISFTSDVIPAANLTSPLAVSLSMASVNPAAGVTNNSLNSFDSSVSGTFSATTVTPSNVPLIYRLPTPVADGDVVVRNFQSGQISDLLRFQTVSDPVQGTVGYMLVFSDVPAATSTETPAPADVGIPTPAASVLTQSAIEFGVQGFDTIEYAAEQANYSGLSDFNAVPFGTA